MSSPCPLCGLVGEMNTWSSPHQIFQCPGCQFVFYGQGRFVDSRALYGSDYFHSGEYADYPADQAVLNKNFGRRLSEMRRFVAGGRLLELGAAYGFFLNVAQKFFDVKGIDVSEEGVTAMQSRGFKCERADFMELADEPQAYDAICLWDTIEHLTRPVETIVKAEKWLRPGGYLFLTTGDVDSVVARWRGPRWRMIHPPTHISYFSKATLRRLLEKNSNFEIKVMKYVGFSRSYKGMIHGIFRARGWKRFYDVLTLGDRLDFPIYANLYDILFVAAQKRIAP